MWDDFWGKTLKKLPNPRKIVLKPITPKGMVTVDAYEQRRFQQAFKKAV